MDRRIAAIETIAVAIPCREPFRISKGVIGTPDTPVIRILVKLHSADGLVGLGEAAPMPSWNWETPESVITTIERYYTPALLGQDPFHLNEVHRRLAVAVRGHGQNCARCAIDIACHDLMGKALGVSVATLLGGRQRERLDVLWGIGLDEPEVMAATARERESAGFRLIKVKLGGDPDADVARVAAIRAALRPETLVSVDANEAYTYVQALRVCTRLQPYNIAWVEQPLPRWDLTGLARLRQAVPIPVMVDESVLNPPDLLNIIRHDGADLLFLKLDKSGGLVPTRELIALARAANVVPVAGGSLNTGVGIAALAQLAAAADLAVPGGYNGPLLLEAMLTRPGDLCYDGGQLIVPDGPGLGVELDEVAVDRYRVDLAVSSAARRSDRGERR